MTLFAANSAPSTAGQLVLATALAALGVFLLLPRPRGRSVAGGIAALIACIVVASAWFNQTLGEPANDWVGEALFTLFSSGAVGFGVMLVVQRNPARGAIAFAFVILSTCGMFLLLAAPFLMAATIIIYAGAIVVTFLFVLMLSSTGVRSDENDRSREPLLGCLAGFAFIGLVLFALDQSKESVSPVKAGEDRHASPLPGAVVTADEKAKLLEAASRLQELEADPFFRKTQLSHERRAVELIKTEALLDGVVGLQSAVVEGSTRFGSIHARLAGYRTDRQADDVLKRVEAIRKHGTATLRRVEERKANPDEVKAEVAKLREEVLLLAGAGELPARNAANLGFLLYSEHLLSIELAGTLLLVATVGAIAIAQKKAVPA